jgi:hypothetical protein
MPENDGGQKYGGVPSLTGTQYYSGPVKRPVCQSGDPVFFSTGTDVHAPEKVFANIRISRTERTMRRFNLQNSSLWTAPFFKP